VHGKSIYPTLVSEFNADPAAPDLPVLNKNENKERRGGGFVWTGAGASSGSQGFAGRIAAMIGRGFGGPTTAAGRYFLSRAGAWTVMGGLSVGVVGGLAGGAWVMSRIFPPPQQQAAAYAAPVLDGV